MLTLSQKEAAALVGLLNRTPMTPAEALFVEALFARFADPDAGGVSDPDAGGVPDPDAQDTAESPASYMAVRVVSRIQDQDDYLAAALSSGLFLRWNGTRFAPAALASADVTGALGYTPGTGNGNGTVTSVGLTVPGTIFTTPVSGSPVTGSGTLALALNTQAANGVLVGPVSGAAAAPTFRPLGVGELSGLTADFATQYALLAGRVGGQTLSGGTAASENLTLQSTAHATKGYILLSGNVGVNNASPTARVDVVGSVTTAPVMRLQMAVSQTANAFEVRNASGAALHYVNSSGDSVWNYPGEEGYEATIKRIAPYRWRFARNGYSQYVELASGEILKFYTPNYVEYMSPLTYVQANHEWTTYIGSNADLTFNPHGTGRLRCKKDLLVDGKSVFNGRLYALVPNSAPVDGNIGIGQVSAWLDETLAQIKFRVRKSDGTYATAAVNYA